MKVWRIQWAYGMGIGAPSTHKDEESAKAETAYWLSDWLLKMLKGSADFNEELGQHLAYVADARATMDEIRRQLSNGEVWAANDFWHDFLDRWEGTWTFPMWVKLGMVIVDTREAEPLRKRRTMEPTETPPYFQYDPGEGAVLGPGEFFADPKVVDEFKKMRQIEPPPGAPGGPPQGGPTMGALKIWEVKESDFRGAELHPSTYTDEEMAARHVARNLVWIINMVQEAIPMWRRQAETGMIQADPDFFDRAFDAVMLAGMDLDLQFFDYKRIWDAYATWKDFEKKYGAGIVPPVWKRIGTVEVKER
jgi:hypothetical protein